MTKGRKSNKTLCLSDSRNILAIEKFEPDSKRNKLHKTPIRLIKSFFLFKLRFHKPGQFSWLKLKPTPIKVLKSFFSLRWLKTVSRTFQDVDFDGP